MLAAMKAVWKVLAKGSEFAEGNPSSKRADKTGLPASGKNHFFDRLRY